MSGRKNLVVKVPWYSVLILLMCVLVFCCVPFQSELFNRLALDQSQPRNVLSWLAAHLTHSDANHLLWNMAALALLGYFIENYQRGLLLASLVAGMIAVDVWFFVQSQFQIYVGISGALNAVLVAALYALRVPGNVWRGNEILWLVFLLAISKNIYEYANSVALFSNTRWQTTPSFHLVGMAAGVVIVIVWHFLAKHKSSVQ